MDRGYVKLWRKTLDSGVLKNRNVWAFWGYCLLKATWKPIEAVVGNQKIPLLPGEFIFGRKRAAYDLDMTEREIRTCAKILENWKNVTIKTTNKFSIISIVNWNIYQQEENQNDQQNDQQPANNLPAKCHIQEVKNINNKRIKEYSSDFEIFYKAYPNKKAPDAAWKAWKKRNGSLPPVDELLEAIGKQKKWRENAGPGDFRPEWKNPATWLNAGSWNDEVNCDDTSGGVGEWLRLKKLEGLS